MQFNIRNGPPSTWQSYRVDGDRDSRMDPYDPADAIASAAHYLQTLITRTGGDIAAAVFGYNHRPATTRTATAPRSTSSPPTSWSSRSTG